MRSTRRITLALALAGSALGAPAVRAQQPAIPPPLLPLHQPLTYRYSDADGFGSITLTDVGTDAVTGGDQLLVSVFQNGVRYNGSGAAFPLPDPQGSLNTLITFTLVAPGGAAYFFEGRMGRAVEFQGRGSYHPLGDPARSTGWGFLSLPLPPGLQPPSAGPG